MQAVPRYDTDRYTVIDKWQTVQCAAHFEVLEEVARMDAEEAWAYDGASSMVGWLVNRYSMTHRTAAEWVRVASALPELPAIAAAYKAGRLSWDQLRSLTRFATPDTDDELAMRALDTPVRELNKINRELTLRDVESAHRERHLTWTFDDELPVMFLTGQMPATEGVELVKTLTRLAGKAPPNDDGTYEPFAARCLDALLMLGSQDRASDRDADRATAVIHIPLSALGGEEAGAETEEGIPIHSETMRRLICDARLQVSVENDDGTVVGVGRTTRNIPPWLARLIRRRDEGCRFPGCNRTRWIHIHHLIHWADGGPTDLDNLISLCPYHHRMLHEGRWALSGDPNGRVTWIRPDGIPFEPGWRYFDAWKHGGIWLEDAYVPDHLKSPDVIDTS
ncbi:MAG: DUF222 domain-containing protein [Acidimicrobiia bacterium]|nr:DUF222 domain-containing protein [Acidimicrobiia bacterium]